MNLEKLIQMQTSGAFKVEKGATESLAVVGGVKLDNSQCAKMADSLGWISYVVPAYDAISRTNKYINGFKGSITDTWIRRNTEVTFETGRKTNTTSYFDRVRLKCNGLFELTIIHGLPGIGGTYGIFSSKNFYQTPVKVCRTLSGVGSYINSLIYNK